MAIQKLKWVSRFEISVERNIEIDPNADPGCHLESHGLIAGIFAGNAILRNFRIWPNMIQKLKSPKTSKDQN